MYLDLSFDPSSSNLSHFAMVITSLLPFFLFAFFVLESIYVRSLRGLICLLGVICCLVIFRGIYYILPEHLRSRVSGAAISSGLSSRCSNYDFLFIPPTANSADTPTSTSTPIHFPSNIFMMAFVLTYLMSFTFFHFSFKNLENVIMYNIGFISLSVLIILANSVFIYIKCGNAIIIIASLVLGILSAVCWATLIDWSKTHEYRYIMGTNTNGVLSSSSAAVSDDVPLCRLHDILENQYNIKLY